MKQELEEDCVNQHIGMLKQIINRWKIYNKNIESSYLTHLDVSNLYGCAMSQKLPVNGFKCVNDLLRFNEDLEYNENSENSDVGYFLEVDVDYSKKLFGSHKNLPFLPERKKLEKVEKLVCSIEDKGRYVIHKSWINIKRRT